MFPNPLVLLPPTGNIHQRHWFLRGGSISRANLISSIAQSDVQAVSNSVSRHICAGTLQPGAMMLIGFCWISAFVWPIARDEEKRGAL